MDWLGGPLKGPDKKWQVLWPRTVAVGAESRGPVQGRVNRQTPQGWVSWRVKEREKVTVTLSFQLGPVVMLLAEMGASSWQGHEWGRVTSSAGTRWVWDGSATCEWTCPAGSGVGGGAERILGFKWH